MRKRTLLIVYLIILSLFSCKNDINQDLKKSNEQPTYENFEVFDLHKSDSLYFRFLIDSNKNTLK